jgi:hypothetical protein
MEGKKDDDNQYRDAGLEVRCESGVLDLVSAGG